MPAELWGLVLNIIGGVVIAAPDLPGLNKYMTPKDLRIILSRLENGETVENETDGFYELISIINGVVNRIPQRKTCVAVQLGHTPYGNPKVKGQFESDDADLPRNDLVEWRIMKQELERRRDKFRYVGLFLFLSGFVLQLVPYFWN